MKMRIKDFTTKIGSGVTPRGGAEVYQSKGIPLFRSQNITNEGLLLDDIAYITKETHCSMSSTQLKPNDVLLNITGASIGRCYYLPNDFKEGNVNQHVCIIRPTSKVLSPYLYYCLISDDGQQKIDITQTGANREGLTKEDISNFEFDIPSLEKQNKIVSYLNDKTEKIDSRISLLTQKRDAYQQLKRALINRVVTKGLNPNAKFKPSGVDWIGDIPEGWEVKRIKEICDFVSRGTTPDYADESKYKVMNQATFSKGYIDDSIIRYTSKPSADANIKRGDLLIASTGGGVLGKVLFYNRDDKSFYADSHVSILRNTKGENSMKFLYYVFSTKFAEINATMVKGSTNQTELQRNYLLAHEIPIPQKEEQQSIASYLDEKCGEIDANIANIEKQIEKYKELKRALISEVVTGKRTV